jgi:hypothetical protein
MAARFWVTGGTGDWNSTTNWSTTSGGASGASVPGSADTATLNASSGSGTVTLDISPDIQTLTCTGFTGTLAFGTNTISLNSTGTIFTGATTMTVTGTPLIICTDSSATGRTVNSGTVTEANSISFRITAGTGALGFGANSVFRNLDFTDGTNPTGYAGLLGTAALTIYGDFKASTGMTASSSANAFTFAATSGTKTINTAGVTFDRAFTFNGVGGTFQLASALTSGATRTVTLTAGALDVNSYTLTTGLFTGTGSGVRQLVTNSVPIVITGSGAVVVNFGTTTNYTVDVSPTFNLTYSGSVGTRTISSGSTSNLVVSPNITVTAGSDTITTSGTTTLSNLIFTSPFTGTLGNATRNIYGNLTLVSGMATPSSGSLVTTFNGVSSQTITTAGKTLDFPITFNGVGGTWTIQDALTVGATRTTTLTNGAVGLNTYTLTTGVFNTNNSNTRLIAFGTGKIVLTGTDALVWTNATGTGFTYTGTSRIEAFGPSTTGTRSFNPSTVSTSTEATALSFYITGGTDTVSFTATSRRVNSMDFTGFSGTFTNSQQTVHGSYTISTGMTVGAGTEVTTFASTSGTKTITINGKTLDFPITFNGVGGTWSFADALTQGAGKAFTMTEGTVNLASGVTSTVGAFATSGTNQKYLQSSTAGVQATLSQATGTVDVSYLTIQDSAATGGATWIAYLANANIDAGNNTGWTFFNNVYANTATDSAAVTDVAEAAATFNAAASDTAALSDSAEAATTFNATISDTAAVTDVTDVAATFNPEVADTATLSDSAEAAATFNAAASDSATLTDATSSALLWNLIDDAQDPNWQNINTI